MVSDYNSRKNEVLASYNTVEELIKELKEYIQKQEHFQKIDLPDPTERLSNLLSDIRSKAERVKADRFNIMVAGESKSGKSTFINAYLGVELLPTDVKQCTSAIIEIRWGEIFSVKVTYADQRIKEISGDEEARAFLKKNAALDDEYRDIPVPTINSEILIKSGLRSREKGTSIFISKSEVEEMLKAPEVQSANIYNLPDYNKRIKEYIKAKKDNWQDIVTKIEIVFPFGDNLRGIEIIDSPGICARGGVSEITSQYIKHADAIIFLKPVIGQSLESTQFNQFMENVSIERNKNALFLVLTHIATKNEADLRRLEEEAQKQFSNKLDKQNILFVDSKAELFAKKFANIENIEAELRKLNEEGNLDDFVLKAYTETNGLFGSGTTTDFIKRLEEKSRFDQIYYVLDTFGRNAHYILLDALLGSIDRLYGKLWNDLNSNIDMFRQKAEDPIELSRKIENLRDELDIIQRKIGKDLSNVVRKYHGDNGIIRLEAEKAKKNFLNHVLNIDSNSSIAFNKLENYSNEIIKQFEDKFKQLQIQIVKEFDENLIKLTNNSEIQYEDLMPDFTDETFDKIKKDTEPKAYDEETKPGTCFKKSHTYSVYSQPKHFELIKDNILGNVEITENNFVTQLQEFVDGVRTLYADELYKNARSKEAVLDKILEAKATAEQMREIIQTFSEQVNRIDAAWSDVNKIKGGITKNVQHNN